jgi:hypothetical protein
MIMKTDRCLLEEHKSAGHLAEQWANGLPAHPLRL